MFLEMLNFRRHLVGFFSGRQAERKEGRMGGKEGEWVTESDRMESNLPGCCTHFRLFHTAALSSRLTPSS